MNSTPEHHDPMSRVEAGTPLHDMTDHTAHPSPQPAPEPEPEPGRGLAPTSTDEALAARWRRIVGLLHDTGLLPIVGRDWVRTVPGGLEFGALDGRAAEEWLRFLDALAERPATRAKATKARGQLALPYPAELNAVRHHLAVTR